MKIASLLFLLLNGVDHQTHLSCNVDEEFMNVSLDLELMV